MGLIKRPVDEGDDVKEYLERRGALYKALRVSGVNAFRGKNEDLQNFLTEYDKSMIAVRTRTWEMDTRAGNAKWYDKAFVKFANVSKNYREFIGKQFLNEKGKLSAKGIFKGTAIAASVSIAIATALGAALPALGIAAVGAAGTTAWGMRIFGGVGAGYAAKKRMEAGFFEKTKKDVERRVLDAVESMKNKTDEQWKGYIEGLEMTSEKKLKGILEGEEHKFADVDAKHKRYALAIGSGTVVAGALASHYIMPHARGIFGQTWEKITNSFGDGKTGFYESSHSPVSDAVVPEKTGGPFLGDSHRIKSGENVWKVTREMYIEHAKEYDLKPDDPKIKNLFHSLKKQGFLGRMGINAENFNDLSDAEKIKILAENKTANAMEWYKSHHGGKLPSAVREGCTVTLDDKGKLFVEDISQIKAGAVHHEPTHSAGKAATAAEHHGRGGRGAVDTSEFDRRIEDARERGAAAEAFGRSEVARLGAEAQALNEQAVAGLTSANARLWNSWLENLGGFKLNTPASQIQEAIGRFSPGITSDMPLAPTAEEMTQRASAVNFTQETFQKFPPLNARETMQQYLERMSRTSFNLFKALSIKNRL
ncbi:MAG: hypothetical protein A2612_03970 [Candidatus Moranbacteria bacterium RIFOXYD1_FULL_44_12]|nr:MAG: hypothetical protein A2612_03970 [Candidatus Moranbacteria bacterium RIFOXYD1_FULL_44_12]